MTPKKTYVPVVAVLNMKGGVGKTTISANVFRILFQRKRVATLLIDLDPQFNLSQTLYTRGDYDKILFNKKTIYSVMEPSDDVSLFETKTTAQLPPKADAVVNTFFYFPQAQPACTLDLLAGDFDIVKYSLMDDHKKLKAVEARFTKFVESAKENYKLICLDCNPSSSFLTICALKVCTHVLVPVRTDRYSILGLEILWKFVHDVIPISPKPKFIVVLNGVTHRAKTVDLVETELRGHPVFGSLTLGNTLHFSKVLLAKTDYTGFATDRRVSWSATVKANVSAVADELSQQLGIK